MEKKIVITDSGLGGLSVLGKLEYKLKSNPIFEKAELIFFNSLYSSDYGYNSIKNMAEKATVFNNALNTIYQNYNPDLILIACNTLSVVYPFTKFAKNPKTEVKGIVESGVSLFLENLKSDTDSKIILFGTPTTINSGIYPKQLSSEKIEQKRIISQACPYLETEIQNNPTGEKTEQQIEKFVKEGIKKSGKNFSNLFAGLCCTHYGYSEDVFYNILSKNFNGNIKILNPNNSILDFLFDQEVKQYSICDTKVTVVSQVKIKRNEINSLGKILSETADKTAYALEKYLLTKNLFGKE